MPSADPQAEQIKQFKDFLVSYNKLSELCFADCVHDFTVRHVRDKEEKCAMNCMEKYMKMNQRISQRFQEFQIQTNEAALAAQKGDALAVAATRRDDCDERAAFLTLGHVHLRRPVDVLLCYCYKTRVWVCFVTRCAWNV
ncbi:hypothetical protein HPB51_005098 [Rhipicephalus microplus]|uniref:Mitochondrial import inner membrane translocase subunit n=1 Tax=Rhipicephalus microplus TaxID=6941 RepID=A0A9J6E5M4_RHIMP|nr:hypothetical protein HPB51_005098 [Rhipicephalus microplus]